MSAPFRPIARLPAPRSIPKFSNVCRAVVKRMEESGRFPNPPVPYATVTEHLDDLHEAEKLTHRGSPAETADRDAKLRIVRADMRALVAHVQRLVDAELEHGPLLIETAGLSMRKRSLWKKPGFTVRYGAVPGLVVLDARSVGRRASYFWQMSTDKESWVDLPQTVVSSTTVEGLTPVTMYYFRFRTLTRAGLSDWSTMVSIIAH